ncbi:unnamed protein product [Amoebophrya sp. A25]|nr:unnamed protein product [Amoebophrya sp. A25]
MLGGADVVFFVGKARGIRNTWTRVCYEKERPSSALTSSETQGLKDMGVYVGEQREL